MINFSTSVCVCVCRQFSKQLQTAIYGKILDFKVGKEVCRYYDSYIVTLIFKTKNVTKKKTIDNLRNYMI